MPDIQLMVPKHNDFNEENFVQIQFEIADRLKNKFLDELAEFLSEHIELPIRVNITQSIQTTITDVFEVKQK